MEELKVSRNEPPRPCFLQTTVTRTTVYLVAGFSGYSRNLVFLRHRNSLNPHDNGLERLLPSRSKHNIVPFTPLRKLGVREQHGHSLQPGRRRRGSELRSAWPQALFQNATAAEALDLCLASTCQVLRGKDTHYSPYSTGRKTSSFLCFRDKKTYSHRLHFHEVCHLRPPVVTWGFAPARSGRSAM